MPQISQLGVWKVTAPWSERNVLLPWQYKESACMWAQNSKFSRKADRVACCQDHRITTYNFLKQLFYISQLHARLRSDRMLLSVSHVSLYTVTGAFMAVFSGSERCPLKCHVSSWQLETATTPAECLHSVSSNTVQYMLLCSCVRSIWCFNQMFSPRTQNVYNVLKSSCAVSFSYSRLWGKLFMCVYSTYPL